MDNISREIETLRKKQKRNSRNQTHHTAVKNAFDGLIRRLNTAKQRNKEKQTNSELEEMSIETSKTETQKEI